MYKLQVWIWTLRAITSPKETSGKISGINNGSMSTAERLPLGPPRWNPVAQTCYLHRHHHHRRSTSVFSLISFQANWDWRLRYHQRPANGIISKIDTPITTPIMDTVEWCESCWGEVGTSGVAFGVA